MRVGKLRSKVLKLFGGPTGLYFIVQVMTSFLMAAIGFLIIETFRQTMQDQSLGTWERRLMEALTLSRIELLMAVLISALGGLALARHMLKEMKKVTKMAKGMARGILSQEVDISGYPEEFRELGKALKELIGSFGNMVLESAGNAEICVNLETRKVILANLEACILLGISRKEIEGKRIEEIIEMFQGDPRFLQILSSEEAVEGIPISMRSPIYGNIELLARTSLIGSDRGHLLSIVLIPQEGVRFDELQERISRMEKGAVVGTLFAEIAHEIRNPLGAMKGMIQLLMEDIPDEDPKMELCRRIVREINKMNDVVEDIYSALEEGSGRSGDIKFDISLVIKESLEYAKSELLRPGLSISETYTPDPIPIRGSPDRLFRALRNIIKNALAFASKSVQIEVWEAEGNAFLSVSNDGEYVSEQEIGKIFDPFYTKGRGMGLGLSIAKRLVEAEGGKIEVEAPREGGLRFTISFPKA